MQKPTVKTSRRIEMLDVVRGVALIAMAVYHFTWDLEFFGYLPQGMAVTGGWRLFARAIASSFLFIVGMSLVLAHLRGIKWRSFLIRLGQVLAGGAAITAATLYFTPQSFVFFGILQQIAVASLIGLLFLRMPFQVPLIAGLAMIIAPNIFTTDAMNPRYLAWIGFAANEPLSNDIVPVFPWTGIVLLGIAAGLWLARNGGWLVIKASNPAILAQPGLTPLRWIGRHALAFYLIHQPVNLALIGTFAYFMPPDQTAVFQQSCSAACSAQGNDEKICRAYCGCVQSELEAGNLFTPYLQGRLTEAQTGAFQDSIFTCSARTIP